jgi:hypothetical protein
LNCTNNRQREIDKIKEGVKVEVKEEGEEEYPTGRKRGSDASNSQSGRAYKISRQANGKEVVDLTDD